MSEKDIIKRVWVATLSGIIVLVFGGLFSAYVQYHVSGAEIQRNARDIENIRLELKESVKKGEYEGIFKLLNDENQENKNDIKALSNKVDENQKDIIKHLFEIKDELNRK